jgi:hypothetical protein
MVSNGEGVDLMRFCKLTVDEHGEPIETDVRDIPTLAIKACPHFIMVAEHYRDDNTCRCNDPKHKEMHEWGYEWDSDKQQWVEPGETV